MALIPSRHCAVASSHALRDSRATNWLARFLIGLAGLIGLIGLGMLVRLMWVRSYNYDELSHAHLAWLVSIGQVPYRDFAANHFPFFWILLWPVMRALPQTPEALLALRGLSLTLNLVSIGCLGALICHDQPPGQRLWAAACLSLVVFSQPAMHFLIEFRPDALANALLFGGLVLLRCHAARSKPVAYAGGLSIGAALLVNTKYALFPLLLAGVALAMHGRNVPRIWSWALAICVGFGAALLGGILMLTSMKIPLDRAWEMTVLYNAAAQKAQAFQFGLAHVLLRHPLLLAYVLAGLAACAVLSILQRQLPGVLTVAIALFLALALATTAKPWKQYLASWLLLAAWFPARYLPQLGARCGRSVQLALALCVLGVTATELALTGKTDPNEVGGINRADQDRRIEWLLQHVPPDGFVVATLDLHPIFRRDTFFKVVSDIMPGKQDGLEQWMPALAPGPYGEQFRRAGYDAELRRRPPSLIMLRGQYSEAQIQAVIDYLNQSHNSYEERVIPDTTILLALRTNGSPLEAH